MGEEEEKEEEDNDKEAAAGTSVLVMSGSGWVINMISDEDAGGRKMSLMRKILIRSPAAIAVLWESWGPLTLHKARHPHFII